MQLPSTSRKKLPQILLDSKPTLIITEELQKKIDYLHSQIRNKEWSGILFCEVGGSISDPNNLVFTGKDIFLMDIGSAAYTEYTFNEELMDAYDANPELMDLKICQIHTHHSMSAFFSGTDIEGLEDNIPHHNYFLSLIVNYAGNYIAKVASRATTIQTISVPGDNGEMITLPSLEGEGMALMDVKIQYETPITDAFFQQRYKTLQEKENKKLPAVYKGKGNAADKESKYEIDWKRVNEVAETSGFDATEVEQFLVSLLTLDVKSQVKLDDVIKSIENKFSSDPGSYAYSVVGQLKEYYLAIYEDNELIFLPEMIADSIMMLANFNGKVTQKVKTLLDKELTFYLEEEEEEDPDNDDYAKAAEAYKEFSRLESKYDDYTY
jgi:hypothetical protein